jgi:predicted nucleic acid-binding protein
MILIGDSSALIALAICDALDLLAALYDKVYVPQAVYLEITQGGRPEADKLCRYLRGKVKNVDMTNYIYLDAYADIGETEAMLLYKQLSADILLIDDKKGRKVAKMNEIEIIGSLGILLKAKKHGLLNEVSAALNRLQNSIIYLDQTLINEVLELAGER